MSHAMNLWERVVEATLQRVVMLSKQQCGFMPRKNRCNVSFESVNEEVLRKSEEVALCLCRAEESI